MYVMVAPLSADAEELAAPSVLAPELEHATRLIAVTDMSATTLMERRDMCMLFPLRCGISIKLTPLVSFTYCMFYATTVMVSDDILTCENAII